MRRGPLREDKSMTRGLLAAAVAAIALAMPASAQDWPKGTVSLVVPFPAGGPLDVMARPTAQKLQEKWGQPVVVENRAGATGTIATNFVVRAKPDGQTLLFTVDLPITMAPSLIKTPYDPLKDLKLIAVIAETEQMLVVHPSVGVTDLAGLVAKAKAEPGKLSFSSAGIGSPGHLCMELIKQATGTDMTHVPYRGAAPAMTALVSGEVKVFCGPLTQGLPHVRGNRAVPIATSGTQRAALTPEVPTLTQAGLKDLVMMAQYYVMAPKDLPDPIAAKLRADLKAALGAEDIKKLFASIGVDLKWLEGDAGMNVIRADLERWRGVVKSANIKVQ
jgi:tripartite-type tricarboxylate transporter receptor subunit TctC